MRKKAVPPATSALLPWLHADCMQESTWYLRGGVSAMGLPSNEQTQGARRLVVRNNAVPPAASALLLWLQMPC